MARARNIKPNIMANESLGELPPLTRLLFIYLWMLADRDGRLEDRPKRIAAMALPFDTGVDVDAILDDLNRTGFIVRYECGGLACIQIANFSKHQSPHVREVSSVLPAVPDDCLASKSESTAKAVPRQCLGDAESSPRSPDSLIPDSLKEESKDREAKTISPRSAGSRLRSDWELPQDWHEWASKERPDLNAPEVAEQFKDHWLAKPGRDGVKADWFATFRNWVRREKTHQAHGRKFDQFAALQKIANERPVTVIDEAGTVINEPGRLPY